MGQPTTQKAWVLAWLETGHILTPFDAAAVGILRLGAIIYDLRQQGYVIEDRNVRGDGRRHERHSAYELRMRPGDA